MILGVKANHVEQIKGKGIRLKCFVPISARLNVMEIYHDEAAQIGWSKTITRLRDELYYPKMRQTFKRYIKNLQILYNREITHRMKYREISRW